MCFLCQGHYITLKVILNVDGYAMLPMMHQSVRQKNQTSQILFLTLTPNPKPKRNPGGCMVT